jgi:hypothetical protein
MAGKQHEARFRVAPMRTFCFSEEELKAIEHERYHHPHPHVQRKREVLGLKSHDLPPQQSADRAGVSLRTVQRYLDEYLEGNLAGEGAGNPSAVLALVFAEPEPHRTPVAIRP